jgi:hypothetical protein
VPTAHPIFQTTGCLVIQLVDFKQDCCPVVERLAGRLDSPVTGLLYSLHDSPALWVHEDPGLWAYHQSHNVLPGGEALLPPRDIIELVKRSPIYCGVYHRTDVNRMFDVRRALSKLERYLVYRV